MLLDTSALLALRDDEAGAERVEALLDGQPPCLACFMTRMEVLDRVWKDEGETAGRIAYEQLCSLPLHWIEASEALLVQAACLKATHSISLADAWIAAAALVQGAVLVHKDPEFRAIRQLSQEWLG